MTPTALRAALNKYGYADAEIKGSVVIVRDRDSAMTYAEHRAALKTAGIPVNWGGVDIPGYYWFSVKVLEESV